MEIFRELENMQITIKNGAVIFSEFRAVHKESLDSSFHLKRTPERSERTRKRCRKRFRKAGSGDASPSENSREELASESALELQHS